MAKMEVDVNVKGGGGGINTTQLSDAIKNAINSSTVSKQKSIAATFSKTQLENLTGAVSRGFKIDSIKSSFSELNNNVKALADALKGYTKEAIVKNRQAELAQSEITKYRISVSRNSDKFSLSEMDRIEKALDKISKGEATTRLLGTLSKDIPQFAKIVNSLSGANDRARTAQIQQKQLEKADTDNRAALKNEEKKANEAYEAQQKAINARAKYLHDEEKRDAQRKKAAEQEAAANERRIRNMRNAEESASVYLRMGEIFNGGNFNLTSSLQSLETGSKSTLTGMRNVYDYISSGGKKGNAQLVQTAISRVDAYVRLVQQVAQEWKAANSEEAKQLAVLKENINSVKNFSDRISRLKTAFGQLSSTLGAIRSVGQTIYKSVVQPILRAVTQTVTQLTSSAFRSSLEALKQLELSEIGFSNFYGAENVQAIMRNVKQNALISPLGAPQLANYVNQLAPISGGNSNLALSAAMGAAKMIQYSGGDVQSEMEYVIKNIRDVYAKNTATTLDIRQFNRAMPALEKALQSVGAEQFLKTENGATVLAIDQTNARQILQAFELINKSEDVGKIFEQTSETLSGLFERVEEQIQLMVIDIADFSDATRWIKQTISDLLDDTDGKIADIKMSLSFVFEDIFDWLKSRDWADIAKTLGEVLKGMFDTFKDALNELRQAFAGMNWKQTLKDLVNLFTSFLTGMIKSYTWLADVYRSIGGLFGTGAANSIASGLGFMSAAPAQFLTGGTRAIGNIFGLVNSGINAFSAKLKGESEALQYAINKTLTFAEALSIATQLVPGLAGDAAAMQSLQGKIQDLGISNAAPMPNAGATVVTPFSDVKSRLSKFYKSPMIQKGMGVLSRGITAIGVGGLAGMAGGAIGNALDSSGITGSLLGSIGGGVAGGAFFGPIGMAVGGLGGIIKSIFEIDGILKEEKKKQLQSVKDEVDSGKFVQKFTDGVNLSTRSLDALNSQAAKLAAEFMETNPTGSMAEMIKYIKEGNGTTKGIKDSFERYAAEDKENYKTLFDLYQKGDISGGNAFAASLKNIGYSSAQLLSGLLGQGVAAGYSQAELNDMILKLGTIQGPNDRDLTYDYVRSLDKSSSDYKTLRNNLQGYYANGIAMEAVADLQNISYEDKTALAKQIGKTLAYIVTDSIEELTDEDKISMTSILGRAGITGGKMGLWLSNNFGISGETAKRMGLDVYSEVWSDQTDKIKDKMSEAFGEIYNESGKTQESLNDLAEAIHGLGYKAMEELKVFESIINTYKKDAEAFQRKIEEDRRNNPLTPTLPDWAKQNSLIHKAAGGDIRGVDTVPAMLQPGEYVVRRSAVSKVGLTALNALNTGNLGYFARAIGRQNIYGDYSGARTWNNTSNDNRKSVRNIVKVYNNSKGARLNRYYSLANRLA